MERYGRTAEPVREEQTIVRGNVRISVLSGRILRLERQESGKFEDRPSQKISCRRFASPEFHWVTEGKRCTVTTEETIFQIDLDTLCARIKFMHEGKRDWVASGCVTPMGGTYRTLDNALGDRQMFGIENGKKIFMRRLTLRDSIFSKEGVTEIDDSASYLLNDDGSLSPRDPGTVDRYVLAFGREYLGGLKEFYHLTGFSPRLPKYALGNWWSRYYAYRQDEYIDLMDRFADKGIPLTVATIDMDWHLVDDVPDDAGTSMKWVSPGWTGYTFNRKLFYDYPKFFRDLKERGLAITMNLHPHDGIRYFEDQYEDMAKANGIDPATKQPVAFDFTDLNFVKSYFDLVLHPYEDKGVDFWWIDWQQGDTSRLKGLDPLWLLNHYHTLDAGRDGRTPLILSRYSGVGAHRYPLGFSGDTIVAWSSLRYQPYFTAAASNAGYTWWSHDIGGHMGSKGDPCLYTRWLQYGVFSPINRLHSTRDKWSKEPWLYGARAEKIVTEFLRLRHRLLPYLYTANVRTAEEGVPLVMPMYYLNDCPEAYTYKNQYYFGENMIVAPVLSKGKKNGEAKVRCWLPEGTWTDFFTGEIFSGGKEYTLTCPLERIPVFVRAGAIIPMLPDNVDNRMNFTFLEAWIYAGDGNYCLRDETGKIDFSVRMKDGKANVSLRASEDIPVREVVLRLIGADPGEIRAEGVGVSVRV